MIPYFPAPKLPRLSLRRVAPLGLAALLFLGSGCTVQASASGWISLGGESAAAAESAEYDPAPPARIGVSVQVSADVRADAAPSIHVTFGPRFDAPVTHRHVR